MFTLSINKGEPLAKIVNTKDFICVKNFNEEEDQRQEKEFHIQDKKKFSLEAVPIFKKRSIVFIAGPSGCGKTTFSMKYINEYLKMNPESSAFIFTANPSDESVRKYMGERIKVIMLKEEDMKKEVELDPTLFRNSIVFFDDMDFLLDDSMIEKVQSLIKRVLGIGRHNNTSIIVSKHMVMDYKSTRLLLAEASLIVTFPHSGSSFFVDSFFKKYFSNANSHIKTELINTSQRWICCRMIYPQLAFNESNLYLL